VSETYRSQTRRLASSPPSFSDLRHLSQSRFQARFGLGPYSVWCCNLSRMEGAEKAAMPRGHLIVGSHQHRFGRAALRPPIEFARPSPPPPRERGAST
jgi:hypothetical protein